MRITMAFLMGAGLAGAATAQTAPMTATLTAQNETPPTTVTGTGNASVTLDKAKGQVCYTLAVSGLQDVTMAHIHKGATGVAGPPVVVLAPPTRGASKGCVPTKPDVIAAIAADPAGYYVNVHNKAFPGGAIRGQLGQ